MKFLAINTFVRYNIYGKNVVIVFYNKEKILKDVEHLICMYEQGELGGEACQKMQTHI